MTITYGYNQDLESWMKLVEAVRSNFPGLETEEELNNHKSIVERFMTEKRALCVKDQDKIVGVLLFSVKNNMICFLAVLPEYRQKGIANELVSAALEHLDRTKNISVTTFREGELKGIAPRALYKKYGFVEDVLVEEFGYPNQRFILYPSGYPVGGEEAF